MHLEFQKAAAAAHQTSYIPPSAVTYPECLLYAPTPRENFPVHGQSQS